MRPPLHTSGGYDSIATQVHDVPSNPSADQLIGFLNDSPTPWHAVASAAAQLQAGGVAAWQEGEALPVQPGGAGYLIRGGGTLAAVRVPAAFDVNNPPPFHVIAAHTDSPGLRLKPRAAEDVFEYRRWGVEVYGGVLLNSWLDRDLGIAGRVSRAGAARGEPKLVRLDRHPLRIPQLAIHLDRTVNESGLILNPQKNLVPIVGQADGGALQSQIETAAGAPFDDLAFDLCLYDLAPARYGGSDDAFILSGRLDNLAMCHAAITAFVATPAQSAVQVVCLFDHEEIGNVSSQGATSNFLSATLERVALALGLSRATFLALLSRSFLVSADMAHAVHPNYPDKHEPAHFPVMNRGVVLKTNTGVRYTSDGPGSARFLDWAGKAGVPVQRFLSRADLACGSTLGPGLSANLGMPAVDIGCAMLSMHSAREMCGAADHPSAIATLAAFLEG